MGRSECVCVCVLEVTLMSCRKQGEREKRRSGREVGAADGGFGPREDASKEHLSQRPAGRLITEREPEFMCVCVCLCV